MNLQSINPLNGHLIKEYEPDSNRIILTKIEKAHHVWKTWRTISYADRARYLRNAAEILENRKQEFASLMAAEMGKPLKEGKAEIEKCAQVCEYYAEQASAFLQDRMVETEGQKSYITFQPLGVVLAVMPWNFPFWQVFRFAAPGVMAGNCGLLKHASNVMGCAVAIEDVFRSAGFPEGVFQSLLIGSGSVNDVIAHPLVKAVTLTGSTEAGRLVAGEAARHLKKTVLELGGSDPYIVLEDANLEKAAEICAQSRLINNGQSCIAAKRFILVKEIEEAFIHLFKEKMAAHTMGDPLDETTDLGPMARKDLRDNLHQQVMDNIEAGARCILGGNIPDRAGNHAFYTPTILTGITEKMPAYKAEIFGPVALIMSARDAEDAIRLANDSTFGLGAAVFTEDIDRGEKIARERLEAGSCFVNSLVRSDPRLPFGGIKDSGYGRELSSFGIHEFVNIKTVYIQ